ncbi:MAG: hypothetical protein HY372_00890 [Candidatus Andersenbacteria bacterium]|nr:hypothetical protein [Candidatus Andersenbacteria bacterium]
MTKNCAICGKTRSLGHTRKLLRGHRNVTAIRTFRPNLQKTIISGQRVLACVKCIRTQSKAARDNT